MKFRVLLFIIVCSWLSPRNGYPNSPQEIIKIAPYGNSITQAARDHQSYRYPLWKKLIDAEIPFDFVGQWPIRSAVRLPKRGTLLAAGASCKDQWSWSECQRKDLVK